jgi:hypothetical protein
MGDPLTPLDTGPLRDAGGMFERAALAARVEDAKAELVSCMASDQSLADILQADRAFHVIRDPRDIIVSAYFSHCHSHPTDGLAHLIQHREALQEVSRDEGLLLEMEYSSVELQQIGEWDYGAGTVLELKMEELIINPYNSFIRIFDHLDLLLEVEPVEAREQVEVWARRLSNRLSRRQGLRRLRRSFRPSGELLLGAVYAQRFEAQASGRTQGEEDVMSHYRKGVAGDWVNYFGPEHIEAFKERFGDLVVRLGYESDNSWG